MTRTKNPIQEVRRSKYFGKEVVGVRHGGRGRPTLIPGICESAYYTINGRYKNMHYRVRTPEGKLLSFNSIVLPERASLYT